MVAPLVARLVEGEPPIGGAQALLMDLCSGLAGRGHAVTLIAPEGSRVTGAQVESLGLQAEAFAAARFEPEAPLVDVAAQRKAFQLVASWLRSNAGPGQVVHAHAYDAPAFELLRNLPAAVCHTLHLPPVHAEVARAVAAAAVDVALSTVSEFNAGLWRAAGVPLQTVIPNGVAIPSEPVQPAAEPPFLLFAGRVTPEKGPDLALDWAAAAGLPLVLAGSVYDRAFYESAIAGRVVQAPGWQPGQALPATAVALGPRSRPAVAALMARASAVLMPARWDEPFGLVAIEAQAAGCPVVAVARGGLAETIDDGRTGRLLDSPAPPEAALAIRQALTCSRAACRAWVQRRYSLNPMLDAYEGFYTDLLNLNLE
ncbi:MAG: glycosyltransferase [Chloroflexota bacterium]